MRVTLIVHGLGGGGAERAATWLADALDADGMRVTLLALADGAGPRYPLRASVTVVALGLESRSRGVLDAVRANLRRIVRLRQAVRSSSPDVVVSFGDTTNVTALLALLGSRIPVVVSERTDPREHPIPSAWQHLRRWTYPLAARVVVQTQAVAQWAREFLSSARIVVIPNAAVAPGAAVAPREATSPAAPAPYVLAVGRLDPVKRYDWLLQRFAAVARPRPQWHLLIAGEGPGRARLEVATLELGLGGRVHLPGRVEEPGSLYDGAEIFVLTSAYEGFPNALLEAMASGRACLSVDCRSGPAEIIDEGRNGLLVPVDDAAAFERQLAALMDDAGLRMRLGASAREVGRSLAPERITQAWREMLREVACSPAAGRRT